MESTIENPAKFTLEWAGGKDAGKFKYYDRERQENISVDSIEFIKLEDAHSISGYSREFGSCFSNECQDHNEVKYLQVFKENGPEVVLTGLWKDIKYESQGKYGGKFTGVIYASTVSCSNAEIGEGTIVRILVKGCSLSPWIEFGKVHKDAKSIKVERAEDHKTGDIEFKSPIFEVGAGTPKSDVNADRKAVRDFLKAKQDDLQTKLGAESGPTEAVATADTPPW
jgi:hypothetical protein